MKGGNVVADIGETGLRLAHGGDLEQAAKRFLGLGGVLANNLSARVRDLSRNASVPELEAYLGEVLAQVPAEALDTLGLDADEAKEGFADARDAFIRAITRTNDAVRKRFGRALAAGAALVEDGAGGIVLVDRNVEDDLRELKRRVEARKRAIVEGAIGGLVTEIQNSRTRLQEQAGAAIEAKNDEVLNRLAKEQIPAEVQKIQQSLKRLQDEIEKHRGKVRDENDKYRACGFDRSAADAYLRGAVLSCSVADLESEVGDKEEDIAEEEAVLRRIGLQRSIELRRARRLALGSLRRRIDSAATRCLALGALSRKSEFDPAFVALSPVRILNPWSLQQEAPTLLRAIDAAAGILRWVRLVAGSTKLSNADDSGHAVDIASLEGQLLDLSQLSLSADSAETQRRILRKVLSISSRAKAVVQAAVDAGNLRVELVAHTVKGRDMRLDFEVRDDPTGDLAFVVGRFSLPVTERPGEVGRDLVELQALAVPAVEGQDPTPGQELAKVLVPLDYVSVHEDEGNRLSNLQAEARTLPPRVARAWWPSPPHREASSRSWTSAQRIVSIDEGRFRSQVLEEIVSAPTRVRLEPGYGDWVFEVSLPVSILARRAGVKPGGIDRLVDAVDERLELRVLLPVLLVK